MEYTDLHDREIRADSSNFAIDINHDGRVDLGFITQLVGDPINQVDKHQFIVITNIQANLPVNNLEEVPVMNAGDDIPLQHFNGYQWFELSNVLLLQKIISFTQPPVWEGHWKNAKHKFMPFQLIADSKRFNGWIELSVDEIGEKIILHRLAISKLGEKMVKAGN